MGRHNSFLGCVFALLCVKSIASPLPAVDPAIIDLGYGIYQASKNFTDNPYPYYNFSNIRYGQAPIGDLRWKAPLPPNGRDETVNGGQTGVIPTQAQPVWIGLAKGFLDDWIGSNNFSDPVIFESAISDFTIQTPDPRESEDCLFLDVIVPEKILKSPDSGAPVVVWIHGGGYAYGDKTSEGHPATFIAKSEVDGADGIVFVSINYRLGLFGWLSGNDNVTANVGLLDQKLALQWVQEHIHRFGGDPSRVTVMGESAGGGSVMHHITSYGGKGPAPQFHQAIVQSPAFQPFVPQQSKVIFNWVLGNASAVAKKPIASAEDLRTLSFEELRTVNAIMIGKSTYGSLTFGPVVDPSPDSYVPDFPLRLINQKKFHDVTIMVSETTKEGLAFTPPFNFTEEQELDQIRQVFPTANRSTVNYLNETLYPPIYDGSQGYNDKIGRSNAFIADFLVGCNAHYLAKTLSRAYSYVFDTGFKLHGEDVDWEFDNGDLESDDYLFPLDRTVSDILQKYIITFAMGRVPAADIFPTFAEYGNSYTVSSITGFDPEGDGDGYQDLGQHITDPAARPQCRFWAEAPFYDADSS